MPVAIIAIIILITSLPAGAQGLARIYVYAESDTAARSWRPISCDGTLIAKLRRGTFFAVNVAPGRHVLSDEKSVPAFVNVGAGEESFVRLDWVFHVGEPATSILSIVRPNQARKDMIYLPYIDANKVLSASVSKIDPRAPPPLRLKRRDEMKEPEGP